MPKYQSTHYNAQDLTKINSLKSCFYLLFGTSAVHYGATWHINCCSGSNFKFMFLEIDGKPITNCDIDYSNIDRIISFWRMNSTGI